MPVAAILGTGTARSLVQVDSATIDRQLGLQEGCIARMSGVDRRPRADRVDQIALAAEAARQALEDAGQPASALDAILHAAAVPYQTIPATAPLVQQALGLPDGAVAAHDIGATCLGFLAALQLAAAMVEAGRWNLVLVVAAEKVGESLDWGDPSTAGLFGDGAGAAVVGRTAGGLAIGPVTLKTYPSGYEAAGLRAGGTRLGASAGAGDMHFRMDGPGLFALTRRHFGAFVADALDKAGLRMEDIDLIVPHQASPVALHLMARALQIAPERLVDLAATHGNQVAASLPVTLDHARRTGRIGPGARVLMLGTAAGVTFGAAVLEAAP